MHAEYTGSRSHVGSLHSPAELKEMGAGIGWVEREMFRVISICSIPYILALTLPVWSPRAAGAGGFLTLDSSYKQEMARSS